MMVKRKKSLPKVGLVLGGGAARALSYLGVLEVLKENNIKLDYIAGSSMGAFIGALYCAGIPIKKIRSIIMDTNWQEIVDLDLPTIGLIKGDRLERYVANLIDNKEFKDLKPKLSVITADIKTGDEVILNRGNVTRAVHASMALPVMFSPVKIGRKTLVDGGIVNPIPADVVKKMGAKIVLAIDSSIPAHKSEVKGVRKKHDLWEDAQLIYLKKITPIIDKAYFLKKPRTFMRRIRRIFVRIFFQPHRILKLISGKDTPAIMKVIEVANTIMMEKLMKATMKNAPIDILIKPKLEMYYIEFNRVDYCIEKGREATKKIIPKLRKLIYK